MVARSSISARLCGQFWMVSSTGSAHLFEQSIPHAGQPMRVLWQTDAKDGDTRRDMLKESELSSQHGAIRNVHTEAVRKQPHHAVSR